MLGLRGQAKTRLIRGLVELLDTHIPIVSGCEINDDPTAPICPNCLKRARDEGDDLEIEWLNRTNRFIEKLATPDVTIADILGDIDPIKAARTGAELSDPLTVHYGLLPRANRCIFAVNELPDLAGKIQVGLFNVLQEGDVQIKGYPIRLPLDIMMAFTANPEDYTTRGKIVTPLKDRIGSEIRTHYPETRHAGIAITNQEAWTARNGKKDCVPLYVREIVEEIAFQARHNKKIDFRSGVSQRLPITCLENVISNSERRAIASSEEPIARVVDVYAALPSITGKFELEYEGELQGAENVARELIQKAIEMVFSGWFTGIDTSSVTEWFEMGGELQVSDSLSSDILLQEVSKIQGLLELTKKVITKSDASSPRSASAVDFILEGLCAQRKISRNTTGSYEASQKTQRTIEMTATVFDKNRSARGEKKKNYYN